MPRSRNAARLVLASVLTVASAAALAQSVPPVGPSDFGTVSSLSASIGDTFLTQPAASSNPLFDFTDAFTFTFGGLSGSASGSAISFSAFADSAITNLQAAIFPTATSITAGTYLSSAGSGAANGPLNAWTGINLGTSGSYTTFIDNNLVAGTQYTVEIRGLIGAAGGSYGGNLTITPVDEPATLGLMAAGLAGMLALRSRRRQATAA